MSDKDEFEKFIMYGGSISKYDCIEMIELIAILSIPLLILERNNIVTIILSLLPLALFFLVVFCKHFLENAMNFILQLHMLFTGHRQALVL